MPRVSLFVATPIAQATTSADQMTLSAGGKKVVLTEGNSCLKPKKMKSDQE